MELDRQQELPPLEVSTAFTGGLQGTVNAEATLGPAPPLTRPVPFYDRARPRLMRLRRLIEPLVTGISDALTVRQPARERPGA